MRGISVNSMVMNQHAVLSSNLLDILFENRNKEYGAYTLRKSYNKRLRIALLSMVSLCFLLCLFFLNRSVAVSKVQTTVITIPDAKPFIYQPSSKPRSSAAVSISHPKKANRIEFPPRIVDSININNFSATPIATTPSSISADSSGISYKPGAEEHGGNSVKGIDAGRSESEINDHEPVNIAEIMPQYPGGIKALLDFLKKNLRSPGGIEGEEVSVKVKFVVNYDGKLGGFDVVKSGGIAFDNEVLRVLKKMPLWIPGKSNGENVSVYYVVPVKFTSEF